MLNIVENTPVDELQKVRFYIDCGDEDFLAISNASLHILLTEKKVPHEYRVRDGSHTWSYWRTGLPDGLKFIGESLGDSRPARAEIGAVRLLVPMVAGVLKSLRRR